jgi:hypothetical protein
MIYEWSVTQTSSPSASELEEALNAFETKGYEIQSILAVGHSVLVVARRRPRGGEPRARPPER